MTFCRKPEQSAGIAQNAMSTLIAASTPQHTDQSFKVHFALGWVPLGCALDKMQMQWLLLLTDRADTNELYNTPA